MESVDADESAAHTGFEREISETSVEYLLFILDANTSSGQDTLSQLEALRKTAIKLCAELTKDYIWQREEFNLELKNEDGLLYLHGTTDYGDAIEDEWLIVYLLRKLTSSHPHLWVRVFDTDGEFFLIEAANTLPKWLSPENDLNRTWLHAGKLFLIPAKVDSASKGPLSLSEAVRFVRAKEKELVHSEFIESEAFYRLEKYPNQIVDSVHHSLLTIPRKLAHVLHALPKSVAPAVEAFYLRDAIALKPILSSSAPLIFDPDDLVTISVRFSKVLYAQLRSQRFDTTPPRWQAAIDRIRRESSSIDADENVRRLEVGMKLTCGFELLSVKAAQSKSRIVRELALTLEDLDEDGPEALASDQDMKAWPEVDRNDSEAWLDINYDDFERELEGKRAAAAGPSKTQGFGDSRQQEHLRKIVSRFEAFLNDDTAGLEGAELEEMDVDDDTDNDNDVLESDEDSDEEDKEVSFDEDEFSRMMREMMGLPSASTNTKTKTSPDAEKSTRKPKGNQEDDEAIKQLTSQFEAELASHGVLRLDPPGSKQETIKGKGKREVGVMSKIKEEGNTEDEEDEDEKEDDTGDEVDIDYNLAKNILESFKSQGGMPGPTSNLLGMMGLQLPRDEDNNEGNEDLPDPARRKR